MMNECIVKKESDFKKYETAEYAKAYDIYKLCFYKFDNIKSHTYTVDDFLKFNILKLIELIAYPFTVFKICFVTIFRVT